MNENKQEKQKAVTPQASTAKTDEPATNETQDHAVQADRDASTASVSSAKQDDNKDSVTKPQDADASVVKANNLDTNSQDSADTQKAPATNEIQDHAVPADKDASKASVSSAKQDDNKDSVTKPQDASDVATSNDDEVKANASTDTTDKDTTDKDKDASTNIDLTPQEQAELINKLAQAQAQANHEQTHENQDASANEPIAFTYLAQHQVLNPIPAEQLDLVKQSINKLHSADAFAEYNAKGERIYRYVNQDLYSGRLIAISNQPVQFPNNTPYGTDTYLTVQSDNGITIYVPSQVANRYTPHQSLLDLMNNNVSTVLTNLITITVDGKQQTYALGSIQSAEYQIGASLQNDFASNPDAFVQYTHQGKIIKIDNINNTATIDADFTNENKGYYRLTMKLDDLIDTYKSLPNITDYPALAQGKEINFQIDGLALQRYDYADRFNHHIKGDYFIVRATRRHLKEYSNKVSLLYSALTGSLMTGYLYGNPTYQGLLIEIAPKVVVGARISYRQARYLRITKNDIRHHAKVTFRLNNMHSLQELQHENYPAIIYSVNSYVKHHAHINHHNGSNRIISQEQLAKLQPAEMLTSNENVHDILNDVMQQTNMHRQQRND